MNEQEPIRLALRPEQAAEALGISRDLFDNELAHRIPSVRVNRLRLFPVAELEKWLEENAALHGVST